MEVGFGGIFMYIFQLCETIKKRKSYKSSAAGDILTKWDELGITKYIYDMYELYHSEAIENAFADIDRLTKKKTKQ